MMKSAGVLSTIATLALVPLGLNAQSYLPLAVENATWIIAYGVEHYTAFFHYAYKIEGDTTYQGEAYKKVYRYEMGWDYPVNTDPPYQIQNKSLTALMRDDTAAKRVYAVILEDQIDFYECVYSPPQEVLLYDFDITVGDSAQDCHSEYYDQGIPVIDVQTEFMYSQERMIWTLETEKSLIAGIGHSSGLFFPSAYVNHAAYGSVSLHYCIGTNFECGLHTHIQPIEGLGDAWVFPNPVQGELHIKSDHHFRSVEIFDAQGRSLAFRDVSASQAIDVSELVEGLYFLKLEALSGEIVGARFMKL